jgi:hypothetical protein
VADGARPAARDRGAAFPGRVIRTRLFGVALALAGAALAILSARVGLAAIHAERAQRFVYAVRDSRASVVADADWRVARDVIAAALSFGGRGAEALELAAQVALYGLQRDGVGADERDALAREAIADLREAIPQRPIWPYAHAALAVAKLDAGEIDAEMQSAVESAMKLGPREGRVHRQLAQLWIAGADRKLAGLAAPLSEAMTLALRDHPERWVDRADRAGRAAELCAREALPKAALARCEQLGWKM